MTRQFHVITGQHQLLSVFNRIFKKLMHRCLKAYLDKQSVFYKSQYGLRDKHSTQHAILEIISQIQTKKDHKLFSCGIFIDPRKAFYTVNHRKTETLRYSQHCQ